MIGHSHIIRNVEDGKYYHGKVVAFELKPHQIFKNMYYPSNFETFYGNESRAADIGKSVYVREYNNRMLKETL